MRKFNMSEGGRWKILSSCVSVYQMDDLMMKKDYIPIIYDPSHETLSHGNIKILESHPNPTESISDGTTISLETLKEIVEDIKNYSVIIRNKNEEKYIGYASIGC